MARIDMELISRNIYETRSKAQFAIKSGVVFCNGKQVLKNSFFVNDTDVLTIKNDVLPYVSKGGLKLEKALNFFHIELKNKKMIDIGASTGGFSDCAIKHGIEYILAIDVGTLQFSKKLLETKKISLLENTDFRNVDLSNLKGYELAAIDVSFISITKLIPKLSELQDLKEIVLLIKPQFEAGIDIAKKYRGVVLNKNIHFDIINKIVKDFNSIGYGLMGLTYSPIRGGSGNIEYLSYFRRDTLNISINLLSVIKEAFSKLS